VACRDDFGGALNRLGQRIWPSAGHTGKKFEQDAEPSVIWIRIGKAARGGTSWLWRVAYRAPVQRSSIPIRARVRAGNPVPDAFLLPCLSQHSPDAVWRICSGVMFENSNLRKKLRRGSFVEPQDASEGSGAFRDVDPSTTPWRIENPQASKQKCLNSSRFPALTSDHKRFGGRAQTVVRRCTRTLGSVALRGTIVQFWRPRDA
jgi:hypothetical protein